MRGREARTALDVTPPGDAKVKEHHQRYQAAYKARHDRTATATPKWEAGDWVRVRKPVSGRVEGQPPVRIARRTGPVSYRLTTGERVHARRLVPGWAGGRSRRSSELCVGDIPVPSPSPPNSSPTDPVTDSHVPRSPDPQGVDLPGLGTPPAPVVGTGQVPRRPQSTRERRPPDRYSP